VKEHRVNMPADVAAYNRELIAEFRANGRQLGERPLLLLTTIGARSGQPRTSPMMYVADGEQLVVVASNAGAAKHPAWLHNLIANPHVVVEALGEEYPAQASVLAGEERERLWERITADHPFFAEYQVKAGNRQIPLVALTRSPAA
jgi:deazaflavin-dependent oxidoreductase (nitroreductase family)